MTSNGNSGEHEDPNNPENDRRGNSKEQRQESEREKEMLLEEMSKGEADIFNQRIKSIMNLNDA